MNKEELLLNLGKLARTLNSQRIISEGEIKEVLEAIVAILAANKKAVDTLAAETKQTADRLLAEASEVLSTETQTKIKEVLKSLRDEYNRFLASLRANASMNKDEIQKSVKTQNDRAFKRLQELISHLELPKNGTDGLPGADGLPGKDGSPDKPKDIRNKLELLKGDERLDAKAIKGLPDYFKKAKVAGKEMLVGGIRFFENLVDVAIVSSKKRQDLLAQYNRTNNRWENGVAFTVSLTAPTNPEINDVWIDLN